MIKSNTISMLAIMIVSLCGCDHKNKATDRSSAQGIAILSGDVTYTLDDAEEVNRQYPDTFWIPSRNVRENLGEGQLVKLLFRITNGSEDQVERMWVEITKISNNGYEGILDNDPYCTKRITAGLKVNFQAQHVIEVYKYDPSNEVSQPTN
ncbi:MAG: DUF2314 domain-containing protein [Desulfuromonadales bacterium]|nr:DUF2314 domain-containing protein [Desulfuromonadales bacterium]